MDERPPDGEGRDLVLVEIDERVAVMTLNRPGQRNALSRALRQMLDTYRRGSGTTANEAWDLEADVSRAWADEHLDPAAVEARRLAIVERGRAQQA